VVASELLEAAGRPAENREHVVGEVVAVAVGHQGNRSGVVIGDGFWEPDVDHRLLLLLEGDRVEGDRSVEDP